MNFIEAMQMARANGIDDGRAAAIKAADKLRAKWQRIVNSKNTTPIGGACAAARVDAAEAIIAAIAHGQGPTQ